MPKLAVAPTLCPADQDQLRAWLRAPSTPQQVALRCRILLAAAQGRQDLEIAAELKINRHTAGLWRKRANEEGIGCVWEIAPGRGRKCARRSKLDPKQRNKIPRLLTLQPPPHR